MSLHTLEVRLRAVEARLADVEGGYGQTLYRMERRLTRHDILLSRIAEHLGVPLPSEAEVDAALDEA